MRRFVASIGGLALGVALSQFPEYAQQYTQRLGGAVNELRILTEEFDRQAAAASLTRDEAIIRYQQAGDGFLAGRGASMERTFDRYAMLSTTLADLRGAGAAERFALMPRLIDTEIGSQTLADFKPAIPVTVEGVLYAGAGFILGYGLVSALMRFFALPFRRRYPVR